MFLNMPKDVIGLLGLVFKFLLWSSGHLFGALGPPKGHGPPDCHTLAAALVFVLDGAFDSVQGARSLKMGPTPGRGTQRGGLGFPKPEVLKSHGALLYDLRRTA